MRINILENIQEEQLTEIIDRDSIQAQIKH